MVHKTHISLKWRIRGALVLAVGVGLAGASPRAGAGVGGPSLGAARSFAVLAGSTVANTGPSAITGDVGVSPGTAITGFPPGTVTAGAIHAGDAAAAAAHADAAIAYAFLLGMSSPPANNLTGQDLGGMTLTPGVYKFNTSAQLTGALTLDAQGDSDALFVIQVGSTLITANDASVDVINGGADYDESCIYWQVGTSATLGGGTAFQGHIVASASITMVTGSSTVGNVLAVNGAATTDSIIGTSPALASADPVLPMPPLTLTAVLDLAGTGADLSWNDASDNETSFNVYRRDGVGPAFVQVGTVTSTTTAGFGATVTFHDPSLPLDTLFTYKVTAFSAADGESAFSNEALVETGAGTAAIFRPLTLTATAIAGAACTGADLTWEDASDNETSFNVYRRDGAGPAFAQVGTVASADTAGTGGVVIFQDPILAPSTTFTYRVTAFNVTDGESVPSTEALVDTCDVAIPVPPPVRYLDVHLGRRRSFISDRDKLNKDRVVVRGSFQVIDVATGIPTVLHDADPRIHGVMIQVRAPGNLVLLTIPPNDPGWTAARRGHYIWKTHDGKDAPVSRVRISTRKSQFSLRSSRNEFGSVPVNSITVALITQTATGSETRAWDLPQNIPTGTKAVFKLPR